MKSATNFARFCEAALPAPWTVFGVRLQPFCTGHALLLQRYGNRLWCGGDFALRDAIQMLFICSRRFAAAARGMERGLGWRWRWLVCRIRLAVLLVPSVWPSRAALLREYMRDALADFPETWQPAEVGAGFGRLLGTPNLVAVLVRLLQLGFTLDAALSLPISGAQWLLLCARELDGAASLVSETERAALAALRSPKSEIRNPKP